MSSLTLQSLRCPAPTTVRGQPLLITTDASNNQYAYSCGQVVYVRCIDEPGKVVVCTRHTAPVTAVRLSPNASLCASGDRDGNVIVWANKENTIVVIQQKPLSGAVKDIAWSDDQERVVVVGEGKESMGAVFAVNGGNSIGTITGHQRTITTCDFKKNRPFRIATGAMDSQVNFYEGPPFKFSHSIQDVHTSTVTCVRFSPNHEWIASVSGSKDILIQEAKGGTKVKVITTEHNGTIYALSWSADSAAIATASADRSVRVYSTATGALMQTFASFGSDVDSMQLGVAFTGAGLLSFGLSGDAFFLNLADGTIGDVWRGHARPLVGMIMATANSPLLLSIGVDGKVLTWSPSSTVARNQRFTLEPANAKLDIIVAASQVNDKGVTVALAGESVILIDPAAMTIAVVSKDPASASGAIGIAAVSDRCFAVLHKAKCVFLDGGKPVGEVKLSCTDGSKFDGTTIAAFQSGKLFAVGGDKVVFVYRITGGGKAELVSKLEGLHQGSVTALAFNHQGTHIASGDSARQIFVWEVATGKVLYEDLAYHASRVNALAFSTDDATMASGSLDNAIIVWDLPAKKRLTRDAAHVGGVTTLAFGEKQTLFSGGADGCIRTWSW